MPTAKLTPKQRKFIKEYARTGNISQSVRNAGYKTNHPAQSGSQLLSNINVQQGIIEVLDKAGLTDEKLAQSMSEGIKQGLESGRATLSDSARFIEMAMKLKDHFPATRQMIAKQELKLSLEGKSMEELNQKYQELLKEAKELSDD